MALSLRADKAGDDASVSRHSRRRRLGLSALLSSDDRRRFDLRGAATAAETLLCTTDMEARLATQLTQFRFQLKNAAKVHAVEMAAARERARVRDWEWHLQWETSLWEDAKNGYRRRAMADIERRHDQRRRKEAEAAAAAWRKCRRIINEVVDAAVDMAEVDEGVEIPGESDAPAALPTNVLRLYAREIGGVRDVEEEEEERRRRRLRGEKLEARSEQRKQEERELRIAKREYDDYRDMVAGWSTTTTTATAAQNNTAQHNAVAAENETRSFM